jgi:hypothetical protein
VFAVGSSTAAASVPATWGWYLNGTTATGNPISGDPFAPLVLRVGSNAPISCVSMNSWTHSGSNTGSPLQANMQASLRFGCQPNGVDKFQVDFTAVGTKNGAVKTLTASASFFRVIDSAGTWDVNGAQFAGTLGPHPVFPAPQSKLTIPAGTQVGTTTVGGHAVTIGGGMLMPASLQ